MWEVAETSFATKKIPKDYIILFSQINNSALSSVLSEISVGMR